MVNTLKINNTLNKVIIIFKLKKHKTLFIFFDVINVKNKKQL